MNCPVSGGAAHSSPTHSKTKAGALTGVRCAISELHLHLLWLARERFAAQRARHYRWAILGFLLTSMMASGQISPGSLSRSHQALDGITDCTTCHRLSTGKPTFRCIDCHSEIGSRVASHRGLHATYNIPPGSSAECVRCHSEHNGEDFLLIKWNPGTFDHKLTGYALEGKHAGVACNQCHTAEHISTEERSTIKVTHLSRTFLGLSRNCTTCHQDSHKGRLGSSCAQCHNYDNWQQISINQFDHSKTRYPLTGLHSQVGCQQCHTAGKDAKPRYTGFPFGRCADCHADPHRGRFEQGCESCHGTQGWNKIASDALSESFDHSKTKFPLLGKHIKVDCVECHSGGDFKKPILFQKCADCHKPDPHGGQFAQRLDKGECAACHTVEGFRPSTFGIKQHATTAYPLQGKHALLQCSQCHIRKGKTTIYKIKFQSCTDCHQDRHAGQFAQAPYFDRCESCHKVQRFRPSTFTLARHAETRFPLTGSHAAVICTDCHRISSQFTPPSAIYHWNNTVCTSCHSDPHQGQFAKLMRLAGSNGKPLGCEACHSTQSWKEFSRFDHSRTSFPLLGSHRTTPCSSCHKAPGQQTAIHNIDFKGAPTACEECHQDVHGAQFAKSGITACAGCHNSTAWKPSSFDHETRTAFPLQGAHRKVECDQCHKSTRLVGTKAILFYKPTPTRCAACHGANVHGQ